MSRFNSPGKSLFRLALMHPHDEKPKKPSDDQCHKAFTRLFNDLSKIPASQKMKYTSYNLPRSYNYSLSSREVEFLPDLYRKVLQRGGNGANRVLEDLLQLLVRVPGTSHFPFLLEALSLTRPRDKGLPQRQEIILSCLSIIAVQRKDQLAFQHLMDLTRHESADIRAQALEHLSFTYTILDQPVPKSVIDRAQVMAAEDSSFYPRFLARQIMQEADLPIPLDNPGGTYTFKVHHRYLGKGVYRVIEVKSEQTLEDLHLGIQSAFEWDNDHLYAFHLDGDSRNESFEFQGSPGMFDSPFGPDAPPTEEAILGKLGLSLHHKFLYLFDFGDNHLFEIEVVAITPKAKRAKYPRIVESKGESFPQYPDGDEWEDEEDWE